MEEIINLLAQILNENDDKKKQNLIYDFQKKVLQEELYSIPDTDQTFLGDLAFQLDDYEPNETYRKQDESYYGNIELREILEKALKKLKNNL